MRDSLLDVVIGLVDVLERLLEVDDVAARTLGQNEALHLRVPATRLVSEVYAAVEQLADGNNGHEPSPFLRTQTSSAGTVSVRYGRRSTANPGARHTSARPIGMGGDWWRSVASEDAVSTRSHAAEAGCFSDCNTGRGSPAPVLPTTSSAVFFRRFADAAHPGLRLGGG